jgi:hypothetical protein
VDHLTMEFNVRNLLPGARLEVQQSPDLGINSWSLVPEANITPVAGTDPETTRYRVALPLTGQQRRFLRLKATEVP